MNQDQEFKQQIQSNDAGEYFSEHNANIVRKNFKKLTDEVSDLREKNIKLRIELEILRFKESQEQRFIWLVWNVYSRNVCDLIYAILGATTYDTEGEAKEGKYALPKHCFDLMKRIDEYTEHIYDGTYLDVEISVDVKNTNPDYYKLKELSDRFYLLLVDNPETKIMADKIMCDIYGKEEK